MRSKVLVLSLVAALACAGAATAGNGKGRFLYTFVGQLTTTPQEATALFASTSGALNLANLSFVHRVVALARVAQAPIADLLAIVPLTSAGTLAADIPTGGVPGNVRATFR